MTSSLLPPTIIPSSYLLLAPQPLPIVVRAYARAPKAPRSTSAESHRRGSLGPSAWTLIFDTELLADPSQQLRICPYQLRRAGALVEQGIAYDPLTLSTEERSTLYAYAACHGLLVRDLQESVEEVFFAYVYTRNALCLCFNAPLDLSRLAISHNSARGGIMQDGFTFLLSAKKYLPRLQIRHLNSHAALIQFTAPARQRTARTLRKRGEKIPIRRGNFVDVKTLATAVLGPGSWSLASLSNHLQTLHRKSDTDEYADLLTSTFLDYAMNDVQVTWECFAALEPRYAQHGLSQTLLTKIYSEASIGKGYLREMGLTPWTQLQPDFPEELLGWIMSSYYGGRSEVHLRRIMSRVLYCDFKSMYPTVCTLMGLWRFVIAKRMVWRDATAEIQAFLAQIQREDLQQPDLWRQLPVLVQIQPEGDRLPVRASYDQLNTGESADRQHSYTIGLNYLTTEDGRPLWYTLADCIASTLLTGKPPKVRRAVRFSPDGVQDGLKPISILSHPEYQVDPTRDDFYQRLIDLRSQIKREMKSEKAQGKTSRAAQLDAEQLALKIIANATSYGIFVELNVRDHDQLEEVCCYGPDGKGFSSWIRNIEKPGTFFHPLLATLITGAARLVLALAECQATEAGISWAFCDTDSLALAQPEGVSEADFLGRAQEVCDWFTPLDPYSIKEPLFKLEDANFRLDEWGKLTKDLEPLYCYAISAKRYVLFNLNGRRSPTLRKASAHGLGHLRSPYTEEHAPKSIPKPAVSRKDLGVDRWEHDVWYRIIQAALDGHPEQVNLTDLPNFDLPAMSRYAATTPALLRWFRRYNQDKSYREQVKPFNFLLAFQPRPLSNRLVTMQDLKPESGDTGHKRNRKGPAGDLPHAIAPFDRDVGTAVQQCFDRETGRVVAAEELQSYRQVLAQYHLHPESKFGNGDYADSGVTERRYILATSIGHIGKEANRWEEQLYLGENPEAQILYGTAPKDQQRERDSTLRRCRPFSVRKLARESGLSIGEVSRVFSRSRSSKPAILGTLAQAASSLEESERCRKGREQEILLASRIQSRQIGIRVFAKELQIDPGYFAKVLSGLRQPSRKLVSLLETTLKPRQDLD